MFKPRRTMFRDKFVFFQETFYRCTVCLHLVDLVLCVCVHVCVCVCECVHVCEEGGVRSHKYVYKSTKENKSNIP